MRDKPIAALRLFAGSLGWSPLRAHEHVTRDDRSRSTSIVWYVAGRSNGLRSDLFLQINEHPIGAPQTYQAAVYALRFRLFTGWHGFRLTADLQCDPAEVERVSDWLHRAWFDSLAARREFRARHPACTGYSWKRIREGNLGS